MGVLNIIPPAARRPATASTLLLAVVAFAYFAWSAGITDYLFSSGPNAGDLIYHQVNDQDADRPLGSGNVYHVDMPSAIVGEPALQLLSSRLNEFLHRPIESHDEAKERMRTHCPLELSDKLVNPDQYNGDSPFWINEVDREMIIRKRAELVMNLASKVEEGEKVVWEQGLGKGKGIVMTAGNKVCTASLCFVHHIPDTA